MSDYKTADLCDHFGDKVQVVEEDFVDLGGVVSFSGPISTIKAFEDNSLVAETLNEVGKIFGGAVAPALNPLQGGFEEAIGHIIPGKEF